MNTSARSCHQCSILWADKTAPASLYMAKCRLHWFGHLLCLPSDHPTQAIYHFDPLAANWRRPSGAPHTCWINVVQCNLDWLGLDPKEVEKTAQNCRHCHSIVDLVGSRLTLPSSYLTLKVYDRSGSMYLCIGSG